MIRARAVGIVMAVGVAFGPATSFAAERLAPKLDATLTAIVQLGVAGASITPKLLRVEPGKDEPFVQTILKFDGSLAAVEAQGANVRSVMGDIATVDIPVSKLTAVAALPSVVSIEAAAPTRKRLDVSVPATRADALRSGTPGAWTGGTGKGVIVGIIDDGLDFRHRDFRHGDGSTRLLGLWDQRTTGAAGSPPAGYSYGGECTPAMLAAAIAGDASACTQPSSGGHGTAVGGVAAGTGEASGNAQMAYRMIGMAPDADLLAANALLRSDGENYNSYVLDAIAWMKAKAAALGKPLVVNLSLGSYYGSRDGTSAFEQGLNNLSGPGVIIVAAAGNEATAAIRATGTIEQDGVVNVGFNIPAGTMAGQMEMYYPGTNTYGIAVIGPQECAPIGIVAPGDPVREIETPCGLVRINSQPTLARNDDRFIRVDVAATATTPLRTGVWMLALTGSVVAGGSAPFSIIGGETGEGLTFTTHTTGQTTEIITDTASARRTIAVAAYNTRKTWTSLAGPYTDVPGSGQVNDIADFSSRGPRRNCSNLAKCPPVMKPEIAAPGAKSMAAKAFDFAPAPPATDIEADGVHSAFSGTSAATPHVAGAVALMLQVNPTLTPEAAKEKLFTTVQTNAFTSSLATFSPATPDMPANPNYTWGYGILDAAAAVRSLQQGGSPVAVVEFYHQGLDHYFITYVADEIAKLDNGTFKGWTRTGQSFKVHAAPQAGTSAVCRIYIPPGKGDGHFFGRDANECDGTMAKNPTFNLESSAFFHLYPPSLGNCGTEQVPVYRVFSNRADANHRYTTDRATRDTMVAKGWIAEGDGADTVVMCAPG